MRKKGEKWSTMDGGEVVITQSLPGNLVRVINRQGFLEVISEGHFRLWLNEKDFK